MAAKPSIKTITVRNLVNFLLMLAILLLSITGYNFRSLSKSALENQALAHADLVRAGLTAQMKAGVMDKRDYYLEEIRRLHQVSGLRVIRGDRVTGQYGPGKDVEMPVDALARRALTSMQPVYLLDEFTWHPRIRVIVPYVASAEGSLNCLACHQVPEGSVLGAVDIELDVTDYRNHSLMVLAIIVAVSFLFLLLILFNTSRTIQRYVQAPLESLIANATLAYQQQRPLRAEEFQTQEFAHVAEEINLFNREIVAHQEMLRDKNLELEALNDEIESTLRETVYTMGVIEAQRSRETRHHTKRVSLYSAQLARAYGLDEDMVVLVSAAAPLHDIGKLGIEDSILHKQGLLSVDERLRMSNHPRMGYDMLHHSQRDLLQAAAIIALQHHEKWDGSGYPQELKGMNIHPYARIVALADVFDALISERVYKESWDLERVIDWIQQERGSHFEPAMVDAFMRSVDEFAMIMKKFPGSGDGMASEGVIPPESS